jgi:histidyl-tRNA synthetase
LARGLDYYTGLIFEIKVPEFSNSSLGGGGRYDKLIEDLSGYKMPAVGVGLGFDRIVEACELFGLIPDEKMGTMVMISFFAEDNCQNKALEIAQNLRFAKIKTELFPALDSVGKQFKVAEQKQIPFVIVVGENEIQENKFTFKNMQSGEQKLLDLETIKKSLQGFSSSLC